MSIAWGPALDAEIAYRHEQARTDFRRPTRRWRAAKKVDMQHLPTQLNTQGWIVDRPQQASRLSIPTQQIPNGADATGPHTPAHVA
jgi:hypothetical protein